MKHVSVLPNEVLSQLNHLKEGDIHLDGTVGYGGHLSLFLESYGCSVKFIGVDRDPEALEFCKDRFSDNECVQLFHGSYNDLGEILAEVGVGQVNSILLDLGVSSPQLDQAERGFSFKADAPLDMRFDMSSSELSAADIVNTYSQDQLSFIFKEYGEERQARSIAKRIVLARKESLIRTTGELASIVASVKTAKHKKSIHPATQVFQALRIEVNQELNHLKEALPEFVRYLAPKGRIAIISFHSLEDRIVKQFFREAEKSCICPKELPVCRCQKESTLKVLTKKPIVATKTEIKNNVRSRSAKLRVAERQSYVPLQNKSAS